MAGSSCWQELEGRGESEEARVTSMGPGVPKGQGQPAVGSPGPGGGPGRRGRQTAKMLQQRGAVHAQDTGERTRRPSPQAPASHDGGVERLDLVPQPPRLLLHLAALLLQLGDVLHRLLQRDGVAGLRTGRGEGGARLAGRPPARPVDSSPAWSYWRSSC